MSKPMVQACGAARYEILSMWDMSKNVGVMGYSMCQSSCTWPSLAPAFVVAVNVNDIACLSSTPLYLSEGNTYM